MEVLGTAVEHARRNERNRRCNTQDSSDDEEVAIKKNDGAYSMSQGSQLSLESTIMLLSLLGISLPSLNLQRTEEKPKTKGFGEAFLDAYDITFYTN